MAKTTSQIIAENKIKRAEAAAIAASRDEIHQKQMEKLTAAKMAAAAAAPVISEDIPQIPLTDTAVSKNPKVEVPLGSAYLTGKQPEVSGSYAAGIQAQQQRTPEQQKIWEAERNTALTKKAMEDYEKRQQQAAEDRKIRDADLQEIQSWSNEDRALLDRYIMERDQKFYNTINPTMNDAFITAKDLEVNPLVEKYGQQRVNELAESLIRQRNEQITKYVEQTAQESAGKNGWAAAGHSLLSIPASAMGGISGTIGLVKDATQRTGRYSTLDVNNEGNLLNTYAGAVRGEVAQNIAGDEYSEEGKQVEEGGAVRKALSYGYQGIMGAADSIARALIGGQYGALGLAAANSFTQTVSEASRQGATPQQAVTLGVGSAILETATEKIPLDEMFKAAKGGTKGVIPVLKEAFRQAGIEATTEELSLAGNLLLEAAVLREKSSYNQKIGELVANGASYQEAKEQANREIFNEVLQTAAVSGFSGFFSGGGSATVGALRTDSTPEVTAPVRQEVGAEAVPAAPTVEPAQQTGPSMEQLLDGVRDMTPAPAPLTEEQQHFDNASAIANGMEPEVQKNAVSEETTVNVRSAGTALTEQNKEKNTLAYTLASNLDSVRDMTPVVQLTGREFNDRTKKMPEQIRDFFKSLGNKVVRVGFGDVSLGEYGVGGMMNHRPLNRSKMVSLAAVPDVIKNGRQIAYEPNWKGRGYETFTFAAPVTVNGTEVYVAAVVNRKPDNKFYLSEMVDSEGNYVRIEESPSGDSKYGVTDGADNSGKAGMPMGPEGLSEGSNPPADAEPMPLPDTIVTDGGNEVKGNQRNFESPQIVDTQNQSPEGGQVKGTGAADVQTNTVGAKKSQFRNEVKKSNLYSNTYEKTQYDDIHDIGRAAQKKDPNIAYYDAITEDESVYEADMRTETGKDRWIEHQNLVKKDGWTSADNDTAMRLLATYRREGKEARFMELAKKQRQMATQSGQMSQSFAKYSREDATVAVLDAVEDLDNMTFDQVDKKFWQTKTPEKTTAEKKDAFQKWKESITGSMLEIANDIENIDDGDVEGLKNIVRQLANFRHTTAWAGYSSDLTKRTEQGLAKMDFDTLKGVAKTQLRMIPNDFRKRDVGEIVKAIRVQNMLFTLTTKFKNDTGNISNGFMDSVSDSFGGRMIDNILSKYTGQRTVGNDLKYANEYIKAAKDSADVAAAFVSLDIPMEMDAKYSSGRTRTFSPNSNNILVRLLSSYEKHMKYALEVSDKFYEGGTAHIVNKSLESLGQKANLTEEQIQSIAQKTGERRTFKDPGAGVKKDGTQKGKRAFAAANVGIQKALNNIGTENIGLGDLVMPFAAVSGEVKQVGMDYTGFGLISGMREIIDIANDAKKGKEIDPYRQRVAATTFGRGMTGVGLIASFAGLAAAGAIKVHNDRDTDERKKDQAQGLSGAQWNLNASLRWWETVMNGGSLEEAKNAAKWQNGDKLESVDFLEPFNTQMHIGYLLSQGEDIATAIVQGNFESLLEMPMMQTISDLADLQQAFTEVSEGDMGGVYDAAGQLLGTVAGSVVPNWMRKTAQVVDPYFRDTYSTNPFEKIGKEVQAAIPFASKNLPKKYDNLGNEQRRYDEGDWMGAAFDSLVTPWDTETYKTSDAYQEIERLNAAGFDTTPPTAKRKVTYTTTSGEKRKDFALSDAQYETMSKVQGETASKVISAMISSKDYAALTDEQKAAAIKMAYSYAKETAEIAAVENHLGYSTNWMKGIKDREARTIIAKTVSSSLDDATGGLQEAWKNGWDVGTQADDLKWAYDTFSQLGKIAKDKVEQSLDGMTADYVEARGEGVSHEAFLDAAKLLEGITPQAGKANPRDFQKAEAIAGMKGVSDADKTLLIKQQMSESQNENLDQMLDLGYSPEEYAGVLKIYRDIYDSDSKTKKEDFIKKLMDRFGMTRAQANAVYQIYK